MSLPLDLKGPMTASNIKCGRNQGYDPDDGSQKAIQLSACLLEHSNMDPEQLCKACDHPEAVMMRQGKATQRSHM